MPLTVAVVEVMIESGQVGSDLTALGGLVGSALNGTIRSTSATVTVAPTGDALPGSTNGSVGGFVGWAEGGAVLRNVIATGDAVACALAGGGGAVVVEVIGWDVPATVCDAVEPLVPTSIPAGQGPTRSPGYPALLLGVLLVGATLLPGERTRHGRGATA